MASHPIQYYAPWFRALAGKVNLHVFYAHRPSARQQSEAGFEVAFDWDVDLLNGYSYTFLENRAARPDVATGRFFGCDTPTIHNHIRSGTFDAFVVMGWNLKCFWQAMWASRRAGVPVLARGDSQLRSERSAVLKVAKAIAYPPALRAFDGFLVVGQRFREYLRHYGVPERRLFHAPHCVDNVWFAKRAQAAHENRAAWDLRQEVTGGAVETPVLLFVGKLIEKKRPQDVLYALARLSGVRSTCIVFVGSGPLEHRLREEARRLDVRAYFAGFRNQTELPRYYAMADALVLPSDGRETWGLVVNEAMACGLPTVVADVVGCAPDLIEEGRTGYTYPVGQVDVLAHCIHTLQGQIAGGHDFRTALREKMQCYSINAAVKGTVRAIQALVPVEATCTSR